MKKENLFIKSIILCRHDSEQKDLIRKMAEENLDWEYISYQIIMHRIAGIVFENLLYAELIYIVPKSVLIYFSDTYYAIQNRFIRYKKEAILITSLLEKNNIPYVLIKGIHLSLCLYEEYKMNPRDFADLDILVPKNELESVGEILKQIGYQHARINIYSDNLEKIKREEIINGKMFYHQIPPFEKKFEDYYTARNSYKIDINYTIFEGGQHKDPISVSELFKKRKCQMFDNFKYYSLSLEYDLIQICFHFYKDIMYPPKVQRKDVYKIINLYDVYLFVTKYKSELNYNQLLSTVKSNYKLEQAVYIVLSLVEKFWGNIDLNWFLKDLDKKLPECLAEKFLLDVDTIVFNDKRFKVLEDD